MKYIILITISFILGSAAVYSVQERNEVGSGCPYYVYHEDERLCLNEKQKEYIENVEAGVFNRLKSKRGVFEN